MDWILYDRDLRHGRVKTKYFTRDQLLQTEIWKISILLGVIQRHLYKKNPYKKQEPHRNVSKTLSNMMIELFCKKWLIA